jgi:transposase
VESIRTLHVVKRSAIKARTQAGNQMTNLIAAGDNPERIRAEAGFAALCGVNPIAASSGKTSRHRLNRSGDRQANNALWTIARVRLTLDPATVAYAKRRTEEGLSHREIV